jgi:hypothetical protein
VSENYLLFSEVLEIKNKKEFNWAKEELIRLRGERDGDDCPMIDFQWQVEGKEEGIWFYADESGDPHKVCLFVQSFLKKFHPKDVFRLTWAATCSRPLVGQFSGGAMVVTAKKIYVMEAGEWAHRKIKELERIKKLMEARVRVYRRKGKVKP